MNKVCCLLLMILTGCALDKPVEKSKPSKVVDESRLKSDCTDRKDPLSCAKLAYHHQIRGDDSLAYRFYKEGCRLKDEASCYNMKSSDPRAVYFKKLDSVMNFHSNNVTNCHLRTRETQQVFSSSQLEERWYKVRIIIHINSAGEADVVKVSSRLSREFKNCAVAEIKSLKFPKPRDIDPTYTFDLTIRSQE